MKKIHLVLDICLVLYSALNILSGDGDGVDYYTFWGILFFGAWDMYRKIMLTKTKS